jgi:hypothetical protein
MAYGHAERNLTLIRQLEAETKKLLGSLNQLDPEQSAWLHEVAGPRRQAGHQYRPEPAMQTSRALGEHQSSALAPASGTWVTSSPSPASPFAKT